MAGLIYLASPYSHSNPAVRKERYELAVNVTAKLILRGIAVFSPIVYGHKLAQQVGIEHEPWRVLNDEAIRASAGVWVLCIPGWQQSRGIFHEVSFANICAKPVRYIDVRANFISRPK